MDQVFVKVDNTTTWKIAYWVLNRVGMMECKFNHVA